MNNPVKIIFHLLYQKQWFNRILLFLWFFSIYSEIPLALGTGKYIPSITLVLLLPFLWPYVKEQFRLKHLLYIFLLTIIALFSVLFQLSFTDLLPVVIRILQFSYSIFLSVITYLFISSLPLKLVRQVSGFFCIIIVAGCALERIGILSPITKAYRIVYANTNYGGEIDEEREIFIAGFARPFFFTSEPSTVGVGFFGFASAFVILNKRLSYDIVILLLTIAEVVLLGSPTVLLMIVMWVVIIKLKYKVNSLWMAMGLVIFTLPFIALFNTEVGYKLLGGLVARFSDEILREGTSMYARIYVPYFITLPKILSNYPFLGVGFGNNGTINQMFGFSADYDGYDIEFFRGSNAFVSLISYIGVGGIIAVILLLYWFHRQNKIPYFIVSLLFFYLMCQMTGTIVTPKLWGFLSLFMAASYRQRKSLIITDSSYKNQRLLIAK